MARLVRSGPPGRVPPPPMNMKKALRAKQAQGNARNLQAGLRRKRSKAPGEPDADDFPPDKAKGGGY